jgi:hypothetical protein
MSFYHQGFEGVKRIGVDLPEFGRQVSHRRDVV